VEGRFAQGWEGFAQVGDRTAQVERKFAQVRGKTAQVERKFARVRERTAQVERKFAQVGGNLLGYRKDSLRQEVSSTQEIKKFARSQKQQ